MIEQIKEYSIEANNDFLVAQFNSAHQKLTQAKACLQELNLSKSNNKISINDEFQSLTKKLDQQIALAKSFDELDALKSNYIKKGSQQYIKHHILSKSCNI
ncbi:MAG: hypothetical protein WCP57_13120 [Bacteroidota bacterium]